MCTNHRLTPDVSHSAAIDTEDDLKKEAIEKLSKECCVTTTTVYRWISGEIIPDALKRKTIAGVLNIDEKELFPKLNNNGMH